MFLYVKLDTCWARADPPSEVRDRNEICCLYACIERRWEADAAAS